MEPKIKVKAMCLLLQGDKVLVVDGGFFKSTSHDRIITPDNFYRVVGGSVEFNETAEEAVRREVMEEIGVQVKNLEFLEVVENRFVYHGEKGHEIVFVYKGFPDPEMDTGEDVVIKENDGYEGKAVWVPIATLLSGDRPLYPAGDYTKFLS